MSSFIVSSITYLQRHLKGLRNVLIVYLLALLVFDAVLPRHPEHAHYLIDKIPDYWAAFTALGCFIMIKVGKGIAHLFLSKNEDYYE